MSDNFNNHNNPLNQKTRLQKELGSTFIASIVADLIFTLLTCGLYNIFIQSRQIRALNFMLGIKKYSFGTWALFSLLTCGLYHVYHEYIMCQDIEKITGRTTQLPLACLLLSLFGMSIVADAIQQNEINRHYGGSAL